MENPLMVGLLVVALFVLKAESSVCRDKSTYTQCRRYRYLGYCQNQNRAFMQINCKRMCNFCEPAGRTGGTCIDKNEHCKSWSAKGECFNNAKYMKTNCCNSCKPLIGRACTDTNNNCASWSSQGYCRSNAAYMMKSCCKSCSPKKAVHGGFGNWERWTKCTRNCGSGAQERRRYCNKPRPQHGGRQCSGKSGQSRQCNTQACILRCANTARYATNCPIWAKEYCVRSSRHYQFMKTNCRQSCGICKTKKKAVDGGFGKWLSWTVCTQSCGGGKQERDRYCNNPEPKNGGVHCKGVAKETRKCNTDPCPLKKVVEPSGKCVDKFGEICRRLPKEFCLKTNNDYKFMEVNCRRKCRFCTGSKRKVVKKKDKCSRGNGGCSQICEVKNSKAVCSCKDTYKLKSDKKTCTKDKSKPDTCGRDKGTGLTGVTGLRVVGGDNAFPFRWLWQGAMYYFEEFTCGGALIAPDLFLTAAHCVSTRGEDGMVIRMGDYNRVQTEEPEQEIEVEKIVFHEEWSWSTVQNDIAIVKLKKEFDLNDEVGLICLPEKDAAPPKGGDCYITGWGRTIADGDAAVILQEAKLPFISNDDCRKRNGDKIVDTMVCGGIQTKKAKVSGCRGDSGGPYVCKRGNKWEITGVVSWGSGTCDVQDKFTVFTRISKYIDWIEKTIKDLRSSSKPVDGGFSKWSEWTACTRTCGEGRKERERLCDNPAPRNGGAKCRGKLLDTEKCNTKDCKGTGKCMDKYGDTCTKLTDSCLKSHKDYDFVMLNCRKTCNVCSTSKRNDKCRRNNGGCEQVCSNKYNKVECSCKDGYSIKPDLKNCAKGLAKAPTCGLDKTSKVRKLLRVVGGENAFPFRWLWQGAMYYFDEFTCGGALIAPDLFLTAAHCVSTRSEDGMVIRMGDYDRLKDEEPEQEVEVSAIMFHEGWSWTTVQNDIALLKLKTKFKLNNEVGTICLPKKDQAPPDTKNCYLTGWGRKGANTDPAIILQQAKMPIVSMEDCKKLNGEKIVDTMLCAGFKGKKSKVSGCKGDSGGPYICKRGNKWELQGVVSWGSRKCDAQEKFTVFTRVSKYIDWIADTIKVIDDGGY